MIAQATTSTSEMFWLGLVLFLGGFGIIWAGIVGWRGEYPEPWRSMGDQYQTFSGSWFLGIPGGLIWIYGGGGLLLIAVTGNDTSGLAGWIWGVPFAAGALVWVVIVLIYYWFGLPDRWLPPDQRREKYERAGPSASRRGSPR